MPRYWYDSVSALAGRKSRSFNLRVLADRKPYFMCYIYPKLMAQYSEYIKNTETKCVREFRLSIDDLLQKNKGELTEQEREFIKYYKGRVPAGLNSCVMNRICRRIEKEFDGYLLMKCSSDGFDYNILKSDGCYTRAQTGAITKLYDRYNKKLKEYMQMSNRGHVDPDERACRRSVMRSTFLSDCQKICSNSSQLCDILVDICYSKESTKQFVWDVCGDELIENLLRNGQGFAQYPELNDTGDVIYRGKRFSMKRLEMR